MGNHPQPAFHTPFPQLADLPTSKLTALKPTSRSTIFPLETPFQPDLHPLSVQLAHTIQTVAFIFQNSPSESATGGEWMIHPPPPPFVLQTLRSPEQRLSTTLPAPQEGGTGRVI